jgi:hypothetical protein
MLTVTLCLYRVHSVGVYTDVPNGGCVAGIQVQKGLLCATSVFTGLPQVRIVRRSGTEPVAHFVWRNGPPADNRI